jgi:DMSO/TMAO reductase YedYZ molybdopterin-dependent catalytic subunit
MNSNFRGFGRGALAGLIAAALMTTVMLALRWALGISAPAELIGDRVAPLLGIDLFFLLISLLGGYNQLKQFGVGSILAGQLAIGALIGGAYALLAARDSGLRSSAVLRPSQIPRPNFVLILIVLVAWAASVILLWPILGTNYRGLPPTTAAIVSIVSLLLVYAVFGLSLVLVYRYLDGQPATDSGGGAVLSRRAVLVAAFGAALAVASGAMLRRLFDLATFAYDGQRYHDLNPQPLVSNDRFYTVTKNIIDPTVVRDVWRLEITGLVDRPTMYRFEDLASMPSIIQETTLCCISNGVGDGLMSNARWTGVPLHALLETAGPRSGIVEVVCLAVDGYSDTFSFEKAMEPTTLVAYEMNGVALPEQHGYPVRLIVPGLFGEKNIKWLTRVALVDQEAKGFYESQGWGPNFAIPIRSHFEAPDFSQPLRAGAPTTLRGLAFAPPRGVGRVEVSSDGGESWRDAELDYRGTPLSWAIWSLAWHPTRPGEYQLVVRAFDTTGAPQIAQERGIAPEGATGYHRVTAQVI